MTLNFFGQFLSYRWPLPEHSQLSDDYKNHEVVADAHTYDDREILEHCIFFLQQTFPKDAKEYESDLDQVKKFYDERPYKNFHYYEEIEDLLYNGVLPFMEKIAPPNTNFTNHPGDGSLGYWVKNPYLELNLKKICCHYMNSDEYGDWNSTYRINIAWSNACYTSFLVHANHIEDAFDFMADFCHEEGNEGLADFFFLDEEEIQSREKEFGSVVDAICCGNEGWYLDDMGNVSIEETDDEKLEKIIKETL